MSRKPLSRGELAFILGVPAAWAILLLFHPGGEADSIYLNLEDKVDRFLAVHVGMLIFYRCLPLPYMCSSAISRERRHGSAGSRWFRS